MMRALSIATFLTLASGCATEFAHVPIPPAPLATDPYADRAAYMKKYYPDQLEGQFLYLHGGDRVAWPEDLAPAVDETSPTGEAIKKHLAARAVLDDHAWIGNVGSGAVTLGLLGILLSPFMLFVAPDDGSHLEYMFVPMAVAGVVGVGGAGLIALNIVLVGDDAQIAQESADKAARTYGQSLSDRLGVSLDHDGNIVDRTQGAPPQIAPPAGAPGGTT